MKNLIPLYFILMSCWSYNLNSQTLTKIDSAAAILYDDIWALNKPTSFFEFEDSIRRDWLPENAMKRGVKLSVIKDSKIDINSLLTTIFTEDGLDQIASILATKRLSDFYFAFYGQPKQNKPWGFSITGPKLSLNFSVFATQMCFTPLYMGLEEVEINEANNKIFQVEIGIPLDFISLLDERQLKDLDYHNQYNSTEDLNKFMQSGLGVQGTKADWNNIIMGGGLAYSDVTKENQRFFYKFSLSSHLGKIHSTLTEKQYDSFSRHFETSLSFIWQGKRQKEADFFYRINTPGFFIEFLRESSESLHITNIIRDKVYDFGDFYLNKNTIKANAANLEERLQKPGEKRTIAIVIISALILIVIVFFRHDYLKKKNTVV